MLEFCCFGKQESHVNARGKSFVLTVQEQKYLTTKRSQSHALWDEEQDQMTKNEIRLERKKKKHTEVESGTGAVISCFTTVVKASSMSG